MEGRRIDRAARFFQAPWQPSYRFLNPAERSSRELSNICFSRCRMRSRHSFNGND